MRPNMIDAQSGEGGLKTQNPEVQVNVAAPEPTFRLKAFRTHVVSVAAEWKGDTLMIHDNTKAWERLAG
jgi:hypothetical protein